VSCELSKADRGVLDEMKVKAGVASDANLARVALWSLADHLGIDMADGVFDLRRAQKQRNPKISQRS